MKKTKRILISAITVISALVLLALFLLPNGMYSKLNKANNIPPVVMAVSDKAEIFFDEDSVTYDGKDNFDAMKGVSAVDDGGVNITTKVKVSVESGESLRQKTLVYSLLGSAGDTIEKTRTLILENYTSPTIKYIGKTKSFDIKSLSTITETLISKGEFEAYDGFGHSITSGIFCDNLNSVTESGKYKLKFSVTNFVSDTASCEVEMEITGTLDKSPIRLTSTSVSVPVGTRFSPMSYVQSANDPDYGDVTASIKYDTNVNTSAPGTYYVYYYVSGVEGVSDARVALTVSVSAVQQQE